jgi:hypothetical protein
MTDYRVVVPLQDGGKIAIPLSACATGDQCVVLPLQDGGKIAVKLNPLATGDQCVVLPLQDGGKIAIPIEVVVPEALISCYLWLKRCAVCQGTATDDPETHTGTVVYGDEAELKLCAYTYDGYLSLLFIQEGETTPYAIFEIHRCKSGKNYLFIETYGVRSFSPLSCWFNKGSETNPNWRLLGSCETGILPYVKSSFKFNENKEVSETTLMTKCQSCSSPEVCMELCNTDICTLVTAPVGTGGQTASTLPISDIATSELFYSSTFPACCDDPARKAIGGTTDLYTSWCTDSNDKCWDGDSWEWCQWNDVWFEKTWTINSGNSNFFSIYINFPGCNGGYMNNELLVDALDIHYIESYYPSHPSRTYTIIYHGPPIGDIDFYALCGSYFIGNGCLWVSILCHQMGEFTPVVRKFTISSGTGSTEIPLVLTVYLESMFYVESATIRVYKAVNPPGYITDFSALTYEIYDEEIIPFTVEDNNGTLYDRLYPYKTVNYTIGDYGIFRLAVIFTNNEGDSEQKFYELTCTKNMKMPICIMDAVTLTPIVTVVSVPPSADLSIFFDFTVESGIVYTCRWTFTLKTDPVFPGTTYSRSMAIKTPIYPTIDLKYAGTYGIVLELNIADTYRGYPEAAPIQTLILDDLVVPVPDPYDSLGISMGPVSSGKREVTFSFGADWYRTGLTLVCNDDADTTVTRTQSSHTATLSTAKVTYTCSEEPYTVEYTVYSPVSTKTYIHEIYITE